FCSTNHGLHFTVKLRGNSRGEFFRAEVPAGSPLLALPLADSRFQDGPTTFCSPWAEVALFLKDSGEITRDPQNTNADVRFTANPTPTPPNPPTPLPWARRLYTLHMRVKAAVPDNRLITTAVPYSQYYDRRYDTPA